VIKAWEVAAREKGARNFRYCFESLDNAEVWSHGRAIQLLGLKIPVADAMSVRQMAAETWPGADVVGDW